MLKKGLWDSLSSYLKEKKEPAMWQVTGRLSVRGTGRGVPETGRHMADSSNSWKMSSGLWATDGPPWTLGLEPHGRVLQWLPFLFCVASSTKHLRVLAGVLYLCIPPLASWSSCPLQPLYYNALSICRMPFLLHFLIYNSHNSFQVRSLLSLYLKFNLMLKRTEWQTFLDWICLLFQRKCL